MSPTTTFGDAEDLATTATEAATRQSSASWLRAPIATLQRWRRLRADLRALQALDDRMLSDIGLDRGRLDAAVSGRR